MPEDKEYLQPCPLSVLQDLLEGYTDPYTIKLAAQSLLLDWHRDVMPGEDRLKVEYSRMWNRSASWVSRHWDEIRELAHRYRTFYASGDGVSQKRNTNGAKISANAAKVESGLDDAEGRKSEGCKNGSQICENGSQTPRKTNITEPLDKPDKDIDDEDDSPAHAPEGFPIQVTENPFSFLSPRHESERAEMREDLAWIVSADNASVQADRTEKVARRLLGGPKHSRKKVPIRRVMRQVKEHPIPACIAAWTLAETKNSPFAYANSLLNPDDESEAFYRDADETEDEWALADG